MIYIKDFSLEKVAENSNELVIRDLTISFETETVVTLFGEEGSGIKELFDYLQNKKSSNYKIIKGVFEIKEKVTIIIIDIKRDYRESFFTPKYIIKKISRKNFSKNIMKIKDLLWKKNFQEELLNVPFNLMNKEEALKVFLIMVICLNYDYIFIENLSKNDDAWFLYELIQYNKKTGYVFHINDISLVNISNYGYVFYSGILLEKGLPHELLLYPQHPYLWDILLAMPRVNEKQRILKKGSLVKNTIELKGDPYASRNSFATNMDFEKIANWYKLSNTHFARSWLLHEDIKGKFELPEQILKRWNNFKEQYG